MKALDILTDAMIESGWVAVGEQPDSAYSGYGLRRLNAILQEWANLKRYAWSMTFQLYTLQANLAPHTIGPSGTFVTPYRPVRIESCSLFLQTSTPGTDVPMRIRDAQWWSRNLVKGVSTSVPTDLYYQPTWPNGTLNFWPIPNIAYQVRIEAWATIAQLASVQSDIGPLPMGYANAIMLTLAERLGGPRSMDPALRQSAIEARAAIQSNNAKSPRVASMDAGMPGGRKDDFNWQTGEPV